MFPNSVLHQHGRRDWQPQKTSEIDSQHWGQKLKILRRSSMALRISALICIQIIYVIISALQKPEGKRQKNLVLKYPVADSPDSN